MGVCVSCRALDEGREDIPKNAVDAIKPERKERVTDTLVLDDEVPEGHGV